MNEFKIIILPTVCTFIVAAISNPFLNSEVNFSN